MEFLFHFFRATFIGIAVAAPVGPMSLLCMERTLRRGIPSGLSTGIGIALADASWAAAIGFGAGSVSDLLLSHSIWLRVVGGLLIALLGLIGALRASAPLQPSRADGSHHGAVISAYALTLANPATVLAFIAIFASLGVADAQQPHLEATIAVVGIFAGSMVWWLGLIGVVAAVRHRLATESIRWINRLAGCALVVFGLWTAARSVLA